MYDSTFNKKFVVYLGKFAFSSKEQLYLTMNHEYMHAKFYSLGLFKLSENGHNIIHNFEADQISMWGNPDAPMDKVINYSVENVPTDYQAYLKSKYVAITVPEIQNNLTTGNSSVYFSKNAFKSLKQLYYTIGHEFVHVSQNTLLSGLTISQFNTIQKSTFFEINAYRYEYDLGNKSKNPYDFESPFEDFSGIPNKLKKFEYHNFPWTQNSTFTRKF